MSGNKSTYTDAMKKASNAAWDQDWNVAIREYRRALSEFSDDIPAHMGLASALQEGRQLEVALNEYELLCRLQPQDIVSLGHVAVLHEQLDHREEATKSYFALGEILTSQGQRNRAIDAWRRTAALDAEHIAAREKLVAVYREAGQNSAAAQELTSIAKIYQRRGELAMAQRTVDQALELNPEQSLAKALQAELRGRATEQLPEAEVGSPVEQARSYSLSRLVATVFDESPRWKQTQSSAASALQTAAPNVESLLAKAIDAQTQGRIDEAIQAYEQVLQAGETRPEIQINLAFLYQSAQRYDDAIALFKQTVHDDQLKLASYMAMGQCYRAQGNVDSALECFIEATKFVDLASVGLEQADEVIRLYESLADGSRDKGAQSDAEIFMQSLLDFLSNKGWEHKVREVRQHIEEVSKAGMPISLAEVVETSNAEGVVETLRLSAQYLKEGHLLAANVESLQAIEIAPNYLPAHVQLAEILVQSGRKTEAREKYEMLAETAVVRGDIVKAISFCRHALELAPEDVTRRAKLIDLLVRQGELPEAVNEFLELGAALERAGQPQKAIDRYVEAMRLAQQVGIDAALIATLRTRLAHAYLQANDWKNALPLFQEIRTALPDDERVHFILTELYLRVGPREEGERELDELLQRYANSPKKTLAVLSTLARNLPNDLPVNLHLARMYAQTGQLDKSIEMLDALGEQLLTNGDRSGAISVVQEIIALQPPHVEDYRQLLEELSK